MKRDQLEHIIRAAGAISSVSKLIIVGSQSILGRHPSLTDNVLQRSMEADLYLPDKPELTELIDGTIGRGSIFHSTFGYYADGVGPETATLPAGWHDRLIEIKNSNTSGVSGLCLEPHDLAVSKLVAGRQKDIEFVEALITCGYVYLKTLQSRIAELSIDVSIIDQVSARFDHLQAKLGQVRQSNGNFGISM